MAEPDLILLALNPSPLLELTERALRATGFEVAIVRNRAGLDASIQEAIPALIIIGETFAGEDGFSISAAMLERFPTLPLILFAEKEAEGLAKAALRAGMSGYLHPPLKVNEIVSEVRKSLERARKLGDWLRREIKRTTASLEEKAKISEAERAKLEAIISNIQDGVVVLDEDQRILLVNRSFRDIFKLDNAEIIGKLLRQTVNNNDLLALLDRSRDEPLKYHEINFDDGRVYNAQYTPIPKIGAAVTMQDISYLKELDRLKNDFLHTISHDLRSPLTAALGYVELIERTGPLTPNQEEFLRRLQGSVQHIASLVNDLLEVGRLEAGFDTRREVVHLESVLKYTLDMFNPQLEKKKIKLVSEVAPDLKPLRAHPIRIRQMMDNLVSNAIKYTPEGGEVRVIISMQDDQIIIKVHDTGPGIPPEEHAQVFEKFYRATTAPKEVEGSGLGLAIVKSIVNSHQGRVWVESAVGEGSTFVVLFPVHK